MNDSPSRQRVDWRRWGRWWETMAQRLSPDEMATVHVALALHSQGEHVLPELDRIFRQLTGMEDSVRPVCWLAATFLLSLDPHARADAVQLLVSDADRWPPLCQAQDLPQMINALQDAI